MNTEPEGDGVALDMVVTTIRGQPIRVRDVFTQLKLKGVFREAVYELIAGSVIEHNAHLVGITPEDVDVQRRVEEKRAIGGIGDPMKFQAYLRMNGVTYEQWTANARVEVLRDRLKETLITKEMIRAKFEQDRHRHESVTVGRIVVRHREEAHAVLEELSRGADFGNVARERSIDRNTREAGGYIGVVGRGLLALEVEEACFDGEDGDVVGPFVESGTATLYKVFAINRSDLNESVAALIREQLFSEWLRREVEQAPA